MTRALRLAVVALAFALLPRTAQACPVCFQNVESGMLDAARIGVLALVAVTVGVLTAFGWWFLKLRKLSALHAGEQEGTSASFDPRGGATLEPSRGSEGPAC
jgi:hypothetical protein